MPDTFNFTVAGIAFTVRMDGFSNACPNFAAEARLGDRTDSGHVSYAFLSQFSCHVNSIDFFFSRRESHTYEVVNRTVPGWDEGHFLTKAFPVHHPYCPGDYDDESGEPLPPHIHNEKCSGVVGVPAPSGLKDWMQAQYLSELNKAMDLADKGSLINESDRSGWAVRLASEAGIEYHGLPMTVIVARIRELREERAQQERVWDERERTGVVVVKLKRCWECGRSVVVGQLKRDYSVVPLSPILAKQAAEAVHEGMRRSVAGMEGQLISSVGFDPAPDSNLEFVGGEDYYCDC